MLASESLMTQGFAQSGLAHLALHPDNRAAVVRRLVVVLTGRSTSAQLRAAEALAQLLAHSPNCRSTIVAAGAIAPLVSLLGTGTRANPNTPPERAAAVLAELAKLAESKAELVAAGGLDPLISMLSPPACKAAQTSAACALLHLSFIAEHKAQMVSKGSIPRCRIRRRTSPRSTVIPVLTTWGPAYILCAG